MVPSVEVSGDQIPESKPKGWKRAFLSMFEGMSRLGQSAGPIYRPEGSTNPVPNPPTHPESKPAQSTTKPTPPKAAA